MSIDSLALGHSYSSGQLERRRRDLRLVLNALVKLSLNEHPPIVPYSPLSDPTYLPMVDRATTERTRLFEELKKRNKKREIGFKLLAIPCWPFACATCVMCSIGFCVCKVEGGPYYSIEHGLHSGNKRAVTQLEPTDCESICSIGLLTFCDPCFCFRHPSYLAPIETLDYESIPENIQEDKTRTVKVLLSRRKRPGPKRQSMLENPLGIKDTAAVMNFLVGKVKEKHLLPLIARFM